LVAIWELFGVETEGINWNWEQQKEMEILPSIVLDLDSQNIT